MSAMPLRDVFPYYAISAPTTRPLCIIGAECAHVHRARHQVAVASNLAAERILESLSNRILDLDAQIQQKSVTFADTIDFINSKKNVATVSKTNSDVKRFKEWLLSDEEERPLEEIPAGELDVLLSRFILTHRNIKTNKELEPTNPGYDCIN